MTIVDSLDGISIIILRDSMCCMHSQNRTSETNSFLPGFTAPRYSVHALCLLFKRGYGIMFMVRVQVEVGGKFVSECCFIILGVRETS